MPRHLTLIACLLTAGIASALDSLSGNFAFEPPKGWVANPPGSFGVKEPIFLAPEVTGGFRANMVLVEEPLSPRDTLAIATKGSVKAMAKAFKRFRVLSETSLRTNSGLEVTKVVYERELRPDLPMMINACYLVIVKDRMLLSVTVSGIQGKESTPKATFEQAEAALLTINSK